MRVVWITHNYPRYAGDVAGAFLHPLAIALRQRGVDVRVVAPSDAGKGGPDMLDGVPILRVRYGSPAEETLAYQGTMASAVKSPRGLMAFNRLRRALSTGATSELPGESGAIIHAHWWIPAGLAAPRSVPLVLTCHGTDIRLLEQSAIAAWFARPVFRRARVVTTVSRSLAASIARLTGVAVRDDAIQPMPVADVVRSVSDRSGGVVVVGRLSAQKRVALALEAMAIARRNGVTSPLTVTGDGPERSILEQQVTRLGLTDVVTFLGQVAPTDIPRIFATAACCLMPARQEGFGLAAAEALMQGVPVVACDDGGGVCEIVSAEGAGKVVPPDASAIATAMTEVLLDPAAGRNAHVAGLHWRARLSPDAVAERCLTWYQRAAHA